MIFTALNMLEASALRFPDKIALKDEVREITFKEFHSFDILSLFCKKDLMDSKTYFADLFFNID